MKKNKVINLFDNNKKIENIDLQYSKLLQDFIKPFENKFEDFEFKEDIFDFAISAWNFGNMSSIIDKKQFKKIMSLAKDDDYNYPLLKSMIQSKVANFKEFTNFIVDFEIYEKNNLLTLTIVTQPEAIYLSSIENLENDALETEFEENYINRSAIALKPLQPFIDWHNSIYPDSKIDKTDLNEVNIYLINNSNFYDIETYLKKKFDLYFKMELEGWSTYKKDWPKKRTYKMFKKWFQVDISTAIYDLEKTPISK